jgi:hypothetical protein
MAKRGEMIRPRTLAGGVMLWAVTNGPGQFIGVIPYLSATPDF